MGKPKDGAVTAEEIKEQKVRKKEVLKLFEDMNLEETRCTFGCYSPNWVQGLATKKMYLAIYCLVGLFLGAYFTYSVSTLSTIEKRFKFTSKQTGLMLAGNDISQVGLAILVAYFGNYGDRPKWMGIGVICAAVSAFLSGTPHLIYGIGEDAQMVVDSMNLNSSLDSTTAPVSKLADFCHDPMQESCGVEHVTSYIGPIMILFLAQFFVGIAVSVFYSIGFAYLDDNVEKRDSPLYYAVSMIIRTMGPVLGFFLGSQCLKLYIDPSYKPNISLRDPRWLGAWWLGYFLLSTLLFVSGLLVTVFPRTLPRTFYKRVKVAHGTEAKREEPLTSVHDITYYIELAKKKERHTKPSFKKLPSALKRLANNKIWVGHTFNTILYLFALMGYWNFKPKYLEFQFRRSASEANFYTGIASLFASILGLGVSGLIVRILKPGARALSGYSIFLTLFSTLTMLSLMMIGCPKLDVQGPMSWSSDLGTCNTDCGCGNRFSPVCSADGKTVYYSPCYAGCTTIDETANPVEYGNCECVGMETPINPMTANTSIPQDLDDNSADSWTFGLNATQGYCQDDCDAFSTYLIVTVITKLIDATGRVGGTVVYFRSLEEHDKGLALGVSTALMSLFAFIPAPIVMGAIVDSACIIWDSTCGTKGNCWLYDSDALRFLIHAVPAAFILLSVLGDIIVFRNCKGMRLYDDLDPNNPQQSPISKEMQPLNTQGNVVTTNTP